LFSVEMCLENEVASVAIKAIIICGKNTIIYLFGDLNYVVAN